MGEALEHESKMLTDVSDSGPKLTVIEGLGNIFTRATDIEIDESIFAGSKLIHSLSNGQKLDAVVLKTPKTYDNPKTEIHRPAREPTGLDEVIIGVMSKTHADLSPELFIEVKEIIQHELGVFQKVSIRPRKLKEITEQHENSDLLSGMRAFKTAVEEFHGDIYTESIVFPSLKFSRWLIARELGFKRQKKIDR